MHKTALNADITHGFILSMLREGKFLQVQRYLEMVWGND